MKRQIKAYTAPVVFDLRDGLMMIADRYNTSDPVSGDWETEVEHEMKTIADAFNISEESAKDLMINELGFGDIDFVELYASTDIESATKTVATPEELSSRPFGFMLHTGNSTYQDDLLRIVEDHGGKGASWYTLNTSTGKLFSNRSYKYIVPSKQVAKDIFKEAKKSMPVLEHNVYPTEIDWNLAYMIRIDDYNKGQIKVRWHNSDPDNKKKSIKSMSLIDVMKSPRGKNLVRRIEDAEQDLYERDVEFDDESEPLARSRKQDIEELRDRFGYVWASTLSRRKKFKPKKK